MQVPEPVRANEHKTPLANFTGPFTADEMRLLQSLLEPEALSIFGRVPTQAVNGYNTWIFQKSTDQVGFPYSAERSIWQTGSRGFANFQGLIAFVAHYYNPALPAAPVDTLPLTSRQAND